MRLTTLEIESVVFDLELPACEGAVHPKNGGPVRWLDIRTCGCSIAKCDACAQITRRDLSRLMSWTCLYCHSHIGQGPLGEYVKLVPYQC